MVPFLIVGHIYLASLIPNPGRIQCYMKKNIENMGPEWPGPEENK